jgi:hypothetical protein
MVKAVLQCGVGAVALFAAVPAAIADTFVEPFNAGPNHVGAWTCGLPVTYPSSGGNPGFYQRTQGLDTFAPQPRTGSGIDSIFTGNYRAAGVTSVGIDLNTFAVDFSAADRPLTVMLVSDNGTPANLNDDWAAYKVGTETIPLPGQGWKAFTFDIPSQSTTLPTGWLTIQLGANSPPNPDWNDVITDVDQLRFFYGDPEFFFIFQMWTIGIDNPRITHTPPTIPGDVNGDGVVNTADLLEVINTWGGCPVPPAKCPADLNGDGFVNTADLLQVINNWS